VVDARPRQPAPGVTSSVLGDRRLVFEPTASDVHVLNPTASLLWDGYLEGLADDELAAALASLEGAPADVDEQVAAFVARVTALGLLAARDGGAGAAGPLVPSRDWSEVPADAPEVLAVAVLDELVVVSADDEVPVDDVRSSFGVTAVPPTGAIVRRLHVRLADGDRVEIVGFGPPRPTSPGRVADALAQALNAAASSSESMLALHAAGLRAPSGEVVVFPAASGAGKSTLAARLSRAGWAYLGDEAIGIGIGPDGRSPVAVAYPKPLSLDAASCEALGLAADGARLVAVEAELGGRALVGEVGPVAAVVLPRFEHGARSPGAVRLDVDTAAVEVARASFNLAGTGQAGLDAVAALATEVPVWRLRHGGVGVEDAVTDLLGS
jgi:hypothetical protein